MADVYQTGVVATFHRLNPGNLKQMESELEECGHHRPMALVLPSLYSELGRPALKKIVEELRQVRYLHRVVVCVDQATPEELRRAEKFFSVLPQKTTLIWTDGPSLKSLYTRLEESDLSVGSAGKGRSAWTAHGYILAEGTVTSSPSTTATSCPTPESSWPGLFIPSPTPTLIMSSVKASMPG